MRWRAWSILRESFLNLGARNLVPWTLLFIAFAGVVVTEGFYSSDLLSFRSTLIEGGAYVATVESADPVLPNSRCSQLGALNGVVGAGSDVAQTSADQPVTISPWAAPGNAFLVTYATPGAVLVWDPDASWSGSRGVVIGEVAADELGVRSGMYLGAYGLGQTPILDVVSSQRNSEVSRRVIVLSSHISTSSRCWVEFSPATFTAGKGLLASWFSVDSSTFVRPLQHQSPFERDPVREFSGRPQRDVWLMIGLAGSLILWFVSWSRRNELALYTALNLSALGRLLMVQVEVLVEVAFAWFVALLWGIAVHEAFVGSLTSDQVVLLVRSSGSAALVVLILGPLGVFVVTRRNVASMLKDRG